MDALPADQKRQDWKVHASRVSEPGIFYPTTHTKSVPCLCLLCHPEPRIADPGTAPLPHCFWLQPQTSWVGMDPTQYGCQARKRETCPGNQNSPRIDFRFEMLQRASIPHRANLTTSSMWMTRLIICRPRPSNSPKTGRSVTQTLRAVTIIKSHDSGSPFIPVSDAGCLLTTRQDPWEAVYSYSVLASSVLAKMALSAVATCKCPSNASRAELLVTGLWGDWCSLPCRPPTRRLRSP